MPRIKDIKHLTGDLAYMIIKGKGEAASEIHYSLQNRSPWFTGTFNTAWEVKTGSPVAPTIPRKDIDNPIFTTRKAPKRQKPIYTSLVKSIYVGNKADYAAFVINQEKSPYEPNQMYEELFNQRRADGSRFKTTPRPNSPNWYFIYLGGNFLEKDINKGFQTVGFKPKRGYTMHKGTSA
tara:strand:- start:5213 stop:5749 length:537 start_codon:yes stop_codon:yes gene_type:complete